MLSLQEYHSCGFIMMRGKTAKLERPSCLPTSPEDITHRGVGLPTACVSGDLPLVALLLAEGSEAGIDMLAPDSVGAKCKKVEQKSVSSWSPVKIR